MTACIISHHKELFQAVLRLLLFGLFFRIEVHYARALVFAHGIALLFGAVVLTDHTPESLDYECVSTDPGTVVFSEIYYPHGWKATIDGEPAEHFRANYTLRAMNVPAGIHKIHFAFDPDSVRKGDTIGVIFTILMDLLSLGIIAVAIVSRCKKAKA